MIGNRLVPGYVDRVLADMHQKLIATGLSAIAGLAFVLFRAISRGKA